MYDFHSTGCISKFGLDVKTQTWSVKFSDVKKYCNGPRLFPLVVLFVAAVGNGKGGLRPVGYAMFAEQFIVEFNYISIWTNYQTSKSILKNEIWSKKYFCSSNARVAKMAMGHLWAEIEMLLNLWHFRMKTIMNDIAKKNNKLRKKMKNLESKTWITLDEDNTWTFFRRTARLQNWP